MNGSRIVLDTNIILYLLAGDETLSDFLQEKEGYVSVITELELIGFPDITINEKQKIRSFLKDCVVIELPDELKEVYSKLRKQYRLKLGDAAAAATAIYLDLPFISADKGFSNIQELQFTLYNL
jgi:hypothetical protein